MDAGLLITAFGLGLVSSLHCVGMCGPLALALPLSGFSARARYLGILIYNIGRISTYTIAGLLVGLIGRTIQFAGYQQAFSITIGVLILLYFISSTGLIPSFTKRSGLHKKIQSVIIHYMGQPSYKNLFITGAANGLLPCGMVYLALGAAAASGDMATAGVFMAFFGIGTLPLLAALSIGGIYIGPSIRKKISRVSPYVTLFMGALLILRGLNLNIPYLSPHIHFADAKAVVSCH
jgi:sulfite exporter TauE/SafE